MEGKPSNLKELIQQGYVFPAWLPEKNDFLLNSSGKNYRQKIISGQAHPNTDVTYLDLGKLDQIKGYFGFLTEKLGKSLTRPPAGTKKWPPGSKIMATRSSLDPKDRHSAASLQLVQQLSPSWCLTPLQRSQTTT